MRKMVEAVEKHDSAVRTASSALIGGVAKNIPFGADIGELVAGAINFNVTCRRGQQALILPELEHQLAHELLARSILAH